MNEPAAPKRGVLRAGLVALLLLAAFFAAGPWLSCSFVPGFWIIDAGAMSACTFGHPAMRDGGWGLPGFNVPFWGNLLAGIGYVIAALYVAFTKRSF